MARSVGFFAAVLTAQAVILVLLAVTFKDRTELLAPVSLSDVLSGTFSAKSGAVNWGNCGVEGQGDTYWRSDSKGIWCIVASSGAETLVVNKTTVVTKISHSDAAKENINNNNELQPLAYSSIILSPNGRKALLTTNYQKIWRHSYVADHFVVNVPYDGKPALRVAGPTQSPQRFASWSPSTEETLVAFVFECNLYVSDVSKINDENTNYEAAVVQISTEGVAGESIGGVDSPLCFGVPDWVYEEEVLATPDATWWSPDGKHIAFLRFDDAAVPITQISYERYQSLPTTATNGASPYPQSLRYRMPKPGFPNPTVDVLIYSVEKRLIKQVGIHRENMNPSSLNAETAAAAEPNYIVARVQWVSPSHLVVRVFNRIQNHERVVVQSVPVTAFAASANELPASSVILERSAQDGWLDFDPPLLFLNQFDNSNTNTDLRFVSVEDVDHFPHLVLYQLDADWQHATRVKVLTSGQWEVTNVIGQVPQKNGDVVVFFTSTQDGPTKNVISAVSVSSSSSNDAQIVFNNGFYSASLSANKELILVSYLGPQLPVYSLYRFAASSSSSASPSAVVQGNVMGADNVYRADNVYYSARVPVISELPSQVEIPSASITLQLVKVLQNNEQLSQTLAKFAMPKKRFTEIAVDGSRVFKAYTIVPYHFDESGSTKYPVLFKVYNGPGSQGVMETFGVSFDDYLASLGIVVVQCDARGTTGRGFEWRHKTYMNLGDFEPKDQIDAAAALAGSRGWVDAKKMAIWGWSYGGYVTSRVAGTDNNNVFKVKMAVAPVTDWRMYDSVYTERFMGLPQDNPNYFNSSVLPLVNNFDPSYLLVHGLADDNVQYINSAALQEALIVAKRQYTTRFYPNRDHSINGGNTRNDLYTYLEDHLRTWLL